MTAVVVGGVFVGTMRADIIGHFEPCMTDIYLHIDARMADYIHTHPYLNVATAVVAAALGGDSLSALRVVRELLRLRVRADIIGHARINM